jgi:hypothetical protein
LSTRQSDSRYELQATDYPLLVSDLRNRSLPDGIASHHRLSPTRPKLSISLNFQHLKSGSAQRQELHTTTWKKFN